MTQLLPVVTPESYLTLHYRLACAEGGTLVDTFEASPATLLLGQGQLAPFLEERLLGLGEGTQHSFTLSPEEAFGARNPDLVQRVSRAALDGSGRRGADKKVGDTIDFTAPGGGQFAGVLRAIDEESALLDFNHPLAGQVVTFEVKLISIM